MRSILFTFAILICSPVKSRNNPYGKQCTNKYNNYNIDIEVESLVKNMTEIIREAGRVDICKLSGKKQGKLTILSELNTGDTKKIGFHLEREVSTPKYKKIIISTSTINLTLTKKVDGFKHYKSKEWVQVYRILKDQNNKNSDIKNTYVKVIYIHNKNYSDYTFRLLFGSKLDSGKIKQLNSKEIITVGSINFSQCRINK